MVLRVEQKTTQKQTAATIQLMSMIQMTGVELHSYMEKMMQENPVFDIEPLPIHDEAFRSSRKNSLNHESDDDLVDFADEASAELPSLYNELCMQIDSLKADEALIQAAKLLAGSLDERGYLSQEDYDAIVPAIDRLVATDALELLQSLSPAGVGARNLSECLCLQLRRLPEDTKLSEEIAANHLELLSKGHFQQIAKLCGASVSDVREAVAHIRSLDPRPGSVYDSRAKVEYVVPDLFLDESGGLSLNSRCMPNLSLSDYYRRMLETNTDAEVVEYLHEKFKQAELLMNNLQQRSATILRCMTAIMANQKAFFLTNGQAALQPLTQAQLAQQIGLSESTVSRAISGKYIQCTFGTYSLVSFFSSSLKGEQNISSADARERVRSLIANEDKTSPLSDQDIADKLSSDGVSLSRRTVAKYRQQMNIPGTYARKEN